MQHYGQTYLDGKGDVVLIYTKTDAFCYGRHRPIMKM